ncbi:MAG: type II secretion system F family protein [Phycisphaerales bacterium]
MAVFAYVARTHAGQRQTGRLTARNREAAVADLQSRQLAPVKVDEVSDRAERGGALKRRTLAGAYRQMGDLLRAGVPLLRALRLLGRGKADPRLAAVMGRLADAVSEGQPLAEAMQAEVGVFPDVHVAMVRAGERGGFLEPVFARLGIFVEQQADARDRIIGQMIYPGVLLSVALGVIVFFLTVLVPQFEDQLARQELPAPTRFVLGTSGFIIGSWPWLLGGLIVLVGFGMWVRAQAGVQRAMAGLRLRLPKLGPVLRDVAVARFARILGTMLENGIPLLAAMRIARDAAGNPVMAEAIDDASDSVQSGATLAVPLGESGLFSEEAVEVIAVGESANNLADVLVTLADSTEKRVDRMMEKLLRLMEPAILLLLGGLVMFMFLALVIPMLKANSTV